MPKRWGLAGVVVALFALVSAATHADVPRFSLPPSVSGQIRPLPADVFTAARIVSIDPPAGIANTLIGVFVDVANVPAGGILSLEIFDASGVPRGAVHINQVRNGLRPSTFPALPAGRYFLSVHVDGRPISRVAKVYDVLPPPPPENLPTRLVTLNLRVAVDCAIDMPAPHPSSAQFMLNRFVLYRPDAGGKFEPTSKGVSFAFVRAEESATALRLIYRTTLPMTRGRYKLDQTGPDFLRTRWLIESCTTRNRTGVTATSGPDFLGIKMLEEFSVPDGKDPIEINLPGIVHMSNNVSIASGGISAPPVRPSEP